MRFTTTIRSTILVGLCLILVNHAEAKQIPDAIITQNLSTQSSGNWLVGGTFERTSVNKRKSEINGSVYILSQYVRAIIINKSGEQGIVHAKYNALDGVFEVIDDKDIINLQPKAYPYVKFNYIDLEDNKKKEMVFKNGYQIAGYTDSDYFQIIQQGEDYTLLKKFEITEKKNSNLSPYDAENAYAVNLIRNDKYILYNNETTEFNSFRKLTRSSIIKAFGYDSKIIKFIKITKVKVGEQEGIKELIMFADVNL